MWVYIPDSPGSTPSPSAPEAEALTSGLSWQCRAIAPSLTWRGRHSPALIWSRRCAKVSWLRRLCGAMPEPSRADSIAAMWIASSGVSHASRIPSPESGLAATMSATSGQPSAASSSRRGPGALSSKTCPEWSPRAGSNVSGETFDGWVLRLRQDLSARKKSGQAMAANGSSCSRSMRQRSWPTATANDFKGSGPTLMRRDGKMRGDRLDYAAEQFWSTPRASDGEKGGPNQSFGAGGVPLPAMASRWPTIRAAEAGQYQYSRGDKTRPVPTLTGAASTWPTPGASQANNDAGLMKSGDGREKPNKLGWAAGAWSTPSVADVTGGRMSRSGARSGEALMKRQALTLADGLCSPPRRATAYGTPSRQSILSAFRRYRATTSSPMRAELRALIRMAIRAERAGQRRGFTRPSFRKSLNPRFVGWLMGWPDHWTRIASTPSACSATALLHWQARMRCALSALPLPGDMTPIQPDLFGG